MAMNVPAGYALASFGGTIAFDEEPMYITIGFDLDGPLTTGLAEALYDEWVDALQGLSSTEWTFRSCRVKAGPLETGPVDEYNSGIEQGSVVATCYPPNSAVLVQKTTALGGRRGRGRMYTVGQAYVGVVNSSGLLDGSHAASLDAAWFALMGQWQAVPGIAGLVLFHNNVSDPTPITGLNPEQRLATQRRRLRP